MGSKSSNLFHFTGEIDYLKGILKNKFMPRYSCEDIQYIDLNDAKFAAYPMVCFCDIPISRILEHTESYGKYGLGLTKEWGLKNKLSPVIYSSAEGPLVKLTHFVLDLDLRPRADTLQEGLAEHFALFFPFIKPINGKMHTKDGNVIDKDFTQESEWRYVPLPYNLLFEDEFHKIFDENAKLADKKLSFQPDDIKYIFVQHDEEIPTLFDFIATTFNTAPSNEIKILLTKIISLETLNKDL